MFAIPALTGIRVLDLSRLLPGPMATHWMQQMGAEVIKVEEPTSGDYMRDIVSGSLFDRINAGKKSIALNLKDAAQRDAFLTLVETADVLVEGFRPGVLNRLGCGYEHARSRNPRLVWIAITGYGQTGEFCHLAGHDINYLALNGVLDLIGPHDGPPSIPGVQLADLVGGSLQAVTETLAALLDRTRTGKGCFVDVSMKHGAAVLLPVPLAQLADTGLTPRRGDETLSGKYACYNVYKAKDGRYVAVGALEAKFWATFCSALDHPEWIEDQFAGDPRRSELKRQLADVFVTKDAEQWFADLRHVDACVTPVRSLPNPEPTERGPHLGEQTEEILASLRGSSLDSPQRV